MSVKILKHPADFKIAIQSKSKLQLFKTAINYLSKFLAGKEISQIKKLHPLKTTKKFAVNSKNNNFQTTFLLINLLNKILTAAYIHQEIYLVKSFQQFTSCSVKVTCYRFPIKKFKRDVKAVTFYQSQLVKNKKGMWKINLVFDI